MASTKKKEKRMAPTSFSNVEGQCENGTYQSLQPHKNLTYPVPLANALRLATESLSHKAWVFFKGYLCARPWRE